MLIHRVLTALIFAPALLYVVWAGDDLLRLACVLVSTLMLWEFLQLTLKEAPRVLHGGAYLLGIGLAAALVGWLPAPWSILLLPLGAMGVLTLGVAKPEPIPESTSRAGLMVLGVLYGAGLFPFISLLRDMPGENVGLGLSLSAIFCTWASDTGAYFAGRAFGRRKLYPKVSPGKTVEGAIGGVVSAVAAAFLIRFLFSVPLPGLYTAGLGAVAGLAGIIGDLSESLLKRSVGAKDSSKLIPGHGGVLDRFDGVMFAAPALYAYATVAAALA